MPSLPLAAILGVFTLAGSLGANKLYYVRNRANRSPNAGPAPVRYRTYTRVNRQLFALIKMPALKLFLCRANLDWISRVEGRSASPKSHEQASEVSAAYRANILWQP